MAEYPIKDGHRALPSRTAAVLEWGKSSGKPSRPGSRRRQGGQRLRQAGSAPQALPPPVTPHSWARGSRGCCWRPWESCWRLCWWPGTAPALCVSGQQQHVLLALYPSVASYPNTSRCPRVYAPPEPGESRGKASGAEGGGRTRASPCPLCAASADVSTGKRRRPPRDHIWGFFELLKVRA